MNAAQIIARIESVAPPAYQAKWDFSGLQIAGERDTIRKLGVMLDPTPDSVRNALGWGADFLFSHHPLSIKPALPAKNNAYRQVLKAVLGADAWLYSAHTSLDVQTQGPVSWLARDLFLRKVRVLEPVAAVAACELRLDLSTPMPASLRSSLMDVEGVLGLSEAVSGLRVVCEQGARQAVLGKLSEHLPDMTYTATSLDEPRRAVGFGLLGELEQALPADAFLERLGECLKDLDGRPWISAGPKPDTVRTVAYCPGSGADLANKAFAMGADVYITGDVKYHAALEAQGFLLDVGHFVLEERMMQVFTQRLEADLKPFGVQCAFFPAQDPFRPPLDT